MSERQDQPYVFVSHASGDREEARRIVGFLKAQGVRTWIAPDDVVPGKEFSIQLEEAIDHCAAFVVILSDNANHSAFVRAETELAFGRREIFPVRLADVQPASGLALFLRLKHWSDAFGPQAEANLARLAETIRIVTGMPEVVAAPAPPLPPGPDHGIEQDQRLGLLHAEPLQTDQPPLSDAEALRTYVGDKAPHFIDAWQRMDMRKSMVGFNVAACLLAPFWALYRKMYLPGLGLAGIYVALWFLMAAGVIRNVPDLFALATMPAIGLAIVTGIFGNHFYREQARAKVRELNLPGEEEQGVRDRLVLHGRTAIGPPIGLAVVGVICVIAAAQLVSPTPNNGAADRPAEVAMEWGDDASQFARNSECDDKRFEGPGMTSTPLLDADVRHDATDCRTAYEQGRLKPRQF